MSDIGAKVEAKTDIAEPAPTISIEDHIKTEEASQDSIMKDADSTAPIKDTEVKEEIKEEIKDSGKDADIKNEEPSTGSVMKDVEVKNEEVKEKIEDSANGADQTQVNRTRPPKFDKYNKNKFDASSLPPSNDPSMIRGQVEFYFSDSNLASDEHLMQQIQGEQNLPVKVAHIHSFKRMRRFQPYSTVVAALRQSSVLKITGPEGDESVQRKIPFDEEKARKDHEKNQRSVYVKGFGDEEATTQFDVEAFFANYGTYRAVRLRRHNDGLFKGSVFVEFEDVETAQNFLNLDPKPTYKDLPELQFMSREVYQKGKDQECKDGGVDPKESRYNHRRNKRGGGGYRGDKDDWNKRRDHDRKNGFRGGRGGGDDGGRGRGRGNGRGRNDRDGRDNRDHRDRRDNRNAEVPKIADTSAQNVKPEIKPEPSKKREREDDDVAEAVPAKKEKLDAKTETE